MGYLTSSNQIRLGVGGGMSAQRPRIYHILGSNPEGAGVEVGGRWWNASSASSNVILRINGSVASRSEEPVEEWDDSSTSSNLILRMLMVV
jgi:hypothetical protein